MKLFHNTVGGNYQYDQYDKTVAYTFPEDAYIDLNGVHIDLSGLPVSCYGGQFDEKSTLFFSKMVAQLPQKLFCNDPHLMINDNDISGSGMPGVEDFNNHNIELITPKEFMDLQASVSSTRNHPQEQQVQQLILFFQQSTAKKRAEIQQKISIFLRENPHYPKSLSILYDDRKAKHSTHIVLTYESPTVCELTIDNTLMMAPALLSEELIQWYCSNYGIEWEQVKEKVSSIRPNFLELYPSADTEKRTVAFEMSHDVSETFINKAYGRMLNILRQLNIPIHKISINHSPYTQKNANECVTFAVQNKIDFARGCSAIITETDFELGTRLRAEHAVLAHLLLGATSIPHENEQACIFYEISYNLSDWYPNYLEVGAKLDQAIRNLSYKELENLYLSTQIDESLALHPSFQTLLLETMQEHFDSSEYIAVTPSPLQSDEAEIHRPFERLLFAIRSQVRVI